MKKGLKYGLISALLITAFSAIHASAKNIATAVLNKAESSNHVTVAVDFSETKTEIITTLRFKLLVAVEEGELAQDDVSFDFAGIPGEVKEAKITYDADVTDYIVDVVVSGKENIFQNAAGAPLVIGTLNLPDGDAYSAEVGLVAYDDGSEDENTDDPSAESLDVVEADETTALSDTVSVLEYVENAGLDVMKIQMKADKQINVGKAAEQPQPETETPQPETPAAQTSSSKFDKPVLTVTPVTGTRKLKFTWEKVSGASGYQIVQYNSKLKKYKKIATVKKGTSYTAKFEFGKTYKFKIRARKKVKKGKYTYGAYSDVVTVKASAFDKKKATTLKVKGKTNNKKITLKWAKVRGADGYKLYQYDSKAGKYEALAVVEGGKNTSYVIRAAQGSYKSAKTYKFMIRAFARSTAGKEVLGVSTAVSYKTYPGQVTGLNAASKGAGKVSLSWKRVSRADGYLVLRSKSGKKGSFKKIAQVKGGKKLSFADKDVESGESYYYVVKAYTNGKGGSRRQGAKSGVVSVEVP